MPIIFKCKPLNVAPMNNVGIYNILTSCKHYMICLTLTFFSNQMKVVIWSLIFTMHMLWVKICDIGYVADGCADCTWRKSGGTRNNRNHEEDFNIVHYFHFFGGRCKLLELSIVPWIFPKKLLIMAIIIIGLMMISMCHIIMVHSPPIMSPF